MRSMASLRSEIGWQRGNAELYQALARRSAHTMQLVDALPAMEAGRQRIEIPGVVPLSELKAGKA